MLFSCCSFLKRVNEITENGCNFRKVVEHRISAIDIHPGSERLLVAAGSTHGSVGIWDLVLAFMSRIIRASGHKCLSFFSMTLAKFGAMLSSRVGFYAFTGFCSGSSAYFIVFIGNSLMCNWDPGKFDRRQLPRVGLLSLHNFVFALVFICGNSAL